MSQTIDWNEQKRIVAEIVAIHRDRPMKYWNVKSELSTIVQHDVDECVVVRITVRDMKAHDEWSYYMGSYPIVEGGADLNVYNLWMLARDVALRVSEGLKASWGVRA